ncbi:anthranilate synthase component I family protein [Leifsonia flava]|uniref:Aminodeoxychorismate synthase component I n=1 Tax=Orlajensenia leifsoniae TaxID=2561933 RepID=A0A4Y9R5V0_9MICO|nr:anthranilate synthase component I family protein [Leifsonia flava]TFV99262.1 aminodeoxychorismate synthase component I [Leifsonia flava]
MPRIIALHAWCDPERVFTELFGAEAHAFWLDAGADAEHGRSWMGAPSTPDGVALFGPRDDVFAFLRSGLSAVADAADAADSGGRAVDDTTRLDGRPLGWVGWLGYELGAQTTGVPLPESRHPEAAFQFIDRAIEFDHGARSVRVIALESAAHRSDFAAWLDRVGRAVATSEATPVRQAPAPTRGVARWRHGPAAYEQLIEQCQQAIRRGDAYQLCLTNTITVDGRFDPLETYSRLRAASPTHHGGLLRFGDLALLSSSPEQFLHVSETGRVVTKPIKGTRPRGRSVVEDIDLRAELEASDKEQAENLMIVDLMRNDLGRIAALGSVRVTSLLAVESYAQVHQLVSTVEADLADGLSGIDAVEACFPAGSMTGAPKISAMRILAELEQGPRGIYSGAFGYFGVDGSIDLAMVIRSIVLTPDAATIGSGGGITALSVPAEEVEETRVKARALLAVLGVHSAR